MLNSGNGNGYGSAKDFSMFEEQMPRQELDMSRREIAEKDDVRRAWAEYAAAYMATADLRRRKELTRVVSCWRGLEQRIHSLTGSVSQAKDAA